MEKASKIFIVLDSILESKSRYIEILKGDQSIFKIKLTVENEDVVHLLDGFFDNDFTVKEITKKEFDDFEGLETLKFNI